MSPEGDLRFVALGDSTTVGVGDPEADGGWRGWSRLLAEALSTRHNLRYENLAVSGATAADVRARQLKRAVEQRPQLASLIVGVNDTMRSTWDADRLRADVLTCVAELSRVGALVLTVRFHDHGAVFGLPGLVRRPLWRRIEAVNAVYDEAWSRYGTLHVDLAVESVVYQRLYWSIDRLHPSDLGHRHLAGVFARHLEGLGYILTPPPDLDAPRTSLPHAWSDARWLTTEGVPWLGRRACDLAPWAIGMLGDEARNRLSAWLGTSPSHATTGTGLELAGSPSMPPPAHTLPEAASA